jgi:hypothetical protein
MKPALLALALLCACTALVPSTVAQLSAIDPARMNPAALQVAVVMPAGLRPQPGSAKLIVEGNRSDTGEAARLEAVLAEHPVTLAGVALEPGDAAYLFQLAEADLAPMRALQTKLAAWDAVAPNETTGSLSVGVGACTTGGGPMAHAEAAVFIRAAEGGPMLPLIARAPVVGLIGAEAMASIGPCTAAE